MDLGKIFITDGVKETIPLKEIHLALVKFENRDWGYVDKEDRELNAEGLLLKGRVLGVYRTPAGDKLYIQLEAGHLSTTILLAEEY